MKISSFIAEKTASPPSKLGLVGEIVLYLVVSDDFFLEAVSTRLRGLNHLDNLGKFLAGTGFQGCNYFLCPGV